MSRERLVPKLRFSGFDDEWIEINIKDYSTIKGRIGWKNLKQSEYTESGPYLIAGKHITNGIINWEECDHLSMERYDESPEIALEIGDVIFSKDGSLGNPALIKVLPDKATINGTMMLVRLHEKVTPNFFYQVLNSESFFRLLHILKSGSSIPHIFQRDMENFKFKIPQSFDEQNKISSLLEKIDEKIELLNNKHQTYQSFKQYLMQEIFAQKLRFDFDDEWKKYLLGEISLIGKGFTPSTSNPSFWDGELKWLSIADMNQGKYINQTTKTITPDGSKNKEPVKKGTLLMSFKLSIGKLGILTEDMYTNEAICNFEWKNKDVLTEYMYYYLSSINILKYGSQAAKGITLNNETLNTIPVLLPSLEEQKKIIKILSDVDLKINMLENSINDTSKFKKGLLQQMFV